MLSCEFCEFSKSTFFSEHLRTTVALSFDYHLTSFRTWLNVGFTTWNPLVENISSVSTIVFKIHVVMTLVFQEKCDVKFLHWHEVCSTCEKTFQIAFNSIWLFFAEIKEHCKAMFGHFSKPFIVGPGTLTVALFVAATSLRIFFYPPPEVCKFTEECWDNMRVEQDRWSL